MQKYKPKTPLANVSDRVLRVMITCGLGIGWFVYLWGHAPYRPDGGASRSGDCCGCAPGNSGKKA